MTSPSIIATPGRLLHLLVEMEMKLSSMEYVVFDEADRLFEMGFSEQLREILHGLPEARLVDEGGEGEGVGIVVRGGREEREDGQEGTGIEVEGGKRERGGEGGEEGEGGGC